MVEITDIYVVRDGLGNHGQIHIVELFRKQNKINDNIRNGRLIFYDCNKKRIDYGEVVAYANSHFFNLFNVDKFVAAIGKMGSEVIFVPANGGNLERWLPTKSK